jgi:hypothetical protein
MAADGEFFLELGAGGRAVDVGEPAEGGLADPDFRRGVFGGVLILGSPFVWAQLAAAVGIAQASGRGLCRCGGGV